MPLTESTKGHLALLFFSLFVAGTYSLGRSAAPYVDATALMALRFLLSAIIMGLIIRMIYAKPRRSLDAKWRFLLLGSIFAFYFASLFEALKVTSAISTSASQ